MSRAETSKLFPAWLISIFKPHLVFVRSSEMQILDNHFPNWVPSLEPVFCVRICFLCPFPKISSSNLKSFRKTETKKRKQKLYASTMRFMVQAAFQPNEMGGEGSSSSSSSWAVGRLGGASIVEPQIKYHLQKSSLALRDSERVTLCLMSK